jgi:hypothetical protein
MGLQNAFLINTSVSPEKKVKVLFNPTEYSIDRGVSYAEQQIPGRDLPILQFVRGEIQTLSLELLLDGTKKREPIENDLEQLRMFTRIDEHMHAPPVCRFEWGGSPQSPQAPNLPSSSGRASPSNFFTGVVTALKEKFTLFNEQGRILRARVTLTLKSFSTAAVDSRQSPKASPDRTRVRVFRQGESLPQLANEIYGKPELWRIIARVNDIERPRFIAPGTPLRIPSIGDTVFSETGDS